MKEVKIFGLVFLLSILISVLILFIIFTLQGTTINISPNLSPAQSTDRSDGSIAFVLSVFIGGIFGACLGIVSMVYLAILMGISGKPQIPMLGACVYAVAIGFLLMLFFFVQMSNMHESYLDLIRIGWVELTAAFGFGFAVALVPLFVVKLYFQI
ncbi:MAG: hypothetical protein IGR93_00015 [Hydrococcus sp. C42_A2020_068]|nr:hypothetical protein [Hydrococcus sp. C42_A2020_068]